MVCDLQHYTGEKTGGRAQPRNCSTRILLSKRKTQENCYTPLGQSSVAADSVKVLPWLATEEEGNGMTQTEHGEAGVADSPSLPEAFEAPRRNRRLHQVGCWSRCVSPMKAARRLHHRTRDFPSCHWLRNASVRTVGGRTGWGDNSLVSTATRLQQLRITMSLPQPQPGWGVLHRLSGRPSNGF